MPFLTQTEREISRSFSRLDLEKRNRKSLEQENEKSLFVEKEKEKEKEFFFLSVQVFRSCKQASKQAWPEKNLHTQSSSPGPRRRRSMTRSLPTGTCLSPFAGTSDSKAKTAKTAKTVLGILIPTNTVLLKRTFLEKGEPFPSSFCKNPFPLATPFPCKRKKALNSLFSTRDDLSSSRRGRGARHKDNPSDEKPLRDKERVSTSKPCVPFGGSKR